MLKKMPVILAIALCAIALLGPYLPLAFKQFLYSTSLSIKTLIILLLPFLIFCLLFKSISLFAKNATRLVFIILLTICCSNFIATLISGAAGSLITRHLNFNSIATEANDTLKMLWHFNISPIFSNNTAIVFGIACGLLFSKFIHSKNTKLITFLDKFTQGILKIILYLVPIFMSGFLIKMQHDGLISKIIYDYMPIFLIIAFSQFFYIISMYHLINHFNIQKTLENLKNMSLAVISGFCTMSSAASMPLTLIGVEKNTVNKDIAKSTVPITVNIHLIGDCFAIPIFAYACIKSFDLPPPSLIHYFIFALYFILAKFSVAAIPGGGIIVMLPILEQHLGFNAEMMSLITTLYILFDPIITSANILGNGMFAKFIDLIGKKRNISQ